MPNEDVLDCPSDDERLPQSLSQVWSAKSEAANWYGFDYWGFEIKRPFDRHYPKGKGAVWPWFDFAPL